MADEDDEKTREDDRVALGVALGAPLGVVLSLLLDTWAMLGVGIALGLVWGAVPSTKDRGAGVGVDAAAQWRVRANLFRGWRALGGHLTLDDEALSFTPHGVDRALGGDVHYRAPLDQIRSVGAARRGAVPRKRLLVVTADGTEARFVVARVEARAADVRRAVRSP